MITYKLHWNSEHNRSDTPDNTEIPNFKEFYEILKNHKKSCGEYSPIVVIRSSEKTNRYLFINIGKIANVYKQDNKGYFSYYTKIHSLENKNLTISYVKELIRISELVF